MFGVTQKNIFLLAHRGPSRRDVYWDIFYTYMLLFLLLHSGGCILKSRTTG